MIMSIEPVKVEVAVSSLPLLFETERDSFLSLSYSNVLLFVIKQTFSAINLISQGCHQSIDS